jgi:N-acetylmuramoyl-L-alanine amidase
MNRRSRAPYTSSHRRRPQAYRLANASSWRRLHRLGLAIIAVAVSIVAAIAETPQVRQASGAPGEPTPAATRLPTVTGSAMPTATATLAIRVPTSIVTATAAPAIRVPTSIPTATAASEIPAPVVGDVAAGTCRVFPPLGHDRHLTVFIDPGHGGLDSGAVGTQSSGTRIDEKDVTLAIGLAVLQPLRDAGFTIVLSRTTDSLVGQPEPGNSSGGILNEWGSRYDIQARIACANTSVADLLVSVHMNAFDDPLVGGTETFFDTARPFGAQSARLALIVQRRLVSSLAAAGWTVPDRGVISDVELDPPGWTPLGVEYRHLLELGPAEADYLDQPSQMPGVLIEPVFISDPFEADIAASHDGQAAIASGLVLAIRDFFSAAGTDQWALHS